MKKLGKKFNRIRRELRRVRTFVERPDPCKVKKVEFAVTYLCDCRCRMCGIWGRYGGDEKLAGSELSLEEVGGFFTGSEYLRGLEAVGLTGGEPFMRRDFTELCGFFIRRFPRASISVATNGLNTKSITGKLGEIVGEYEPPILNVSVSLDGLSATHDRMRGRKGAFKKVLETVEELKGFDDVGLSLSYTITPDNYRDLVRVYELSGDLGVGFSARFAQASAVYYGGGGFDWSAQELREASGLIDRVIEGKYSGRGFVLKALKQDAYFLSRTVEYQKNPSRLFDCFSGTHSFFLDPYGNVYPCVMLDKKFGGLRETGFDVMWLSPEAEKIRESIKSGGCHCWTGCEVIPSLQRSAKPILWNLKRAFR